MTSPGVIKASQVVDIKDTLAEVNSVLLIISTVKYITVKHIQLTVTRSIPGTGRQFCREAPHCHLAFSALIIRSDTTTLAGAHHGHCLYHRY